ASPDSWFLLPECQLGSAALAAEHRDRAAVLRLARNVVAERHRLLLAVRDGAQAAGGDAAADEEVAGGGSAPRAERDVVFACAAFVGMSFDRDLVVAVPVQPLRLLGQGRL